MKKLITIALLFLCFVSKAQVYRMKYHYYRVAKWHYGSDTYILSDAVKGGVITFDERAYQGDNTKKATTAVLKIDGKTYNLALKQSETDGNVTEYRYKIKGTEYMVQVDNNWSVLIMYLYGGTKTAYYISDDPLTAELISD